MSTRSSRERRLETCPVEQSATFETVINRRSAAALGLTIPGELMLRADRVIE
jgi:ABC-type uncharacterized transport system substrate-binding protein